MKKNIACLELDPSLLRWLVDKLKAAPAQLGGAGELLEAAQELQSLSLIHIWPMPTASSGGFPTAIRPCSPATAPT